jgi:hypothetical protein
MLTGSGAECQLRALIEILAPFTAIGLSQGRQQSLPHRHKRLYRQVIDESSCLGRASTLFIMFRP